MIERTNAYAGETEMELVNADVGVLFDEINKGLDPTTLPQGKITLDKLRTTTPNSGTTAYLVGLSTGPTQIPAGGVQLINISYNSPVSGVGLNSGQYYPVTPYLDFFVDPAGSGGSSITNAYANSTWNATGVPGAKILPTSYLNNSSTGGVQLFILTIAVYNFDSVAHWVYVSVSSEVINTQASTAS